jgi:hypothetical protein
MVILLVTQAFGWSHRGHVWDAAELPLRVCADRPLDTATNRAIALWNRDAGAPWLIASCDAPHATVSFDADDPGPIADFQLHPTDTTPEVAPCSYTRVDAGRADIRFSDDIDWSQPVGTAAGPCEPDALQVRLLVRYLGITLGLDSSASSDAMGAFDDCAVPAVSAEDQDGLRALYGSPAACAPGVPPDSLDPTAHPGAGCASVSGRATGLLALFALLLGRPLRRGPAAHWTDARRGPDST